MPGVASEAACSPTAIPIALSKTPVKCNGKSRAKTCLVANPAALISNCGTTCSLKGESVTAKMFVLGKDHVQQISAVMNQHV